MLRSTFLLFRNSAPDHLMVLRPNQKRKYLGLSSVMSLLWRSSDLRQSQEIDRLHVDEQHSGDLAIPHVHHCRRSAAARHNYHPVHRPRHGHGAGHLAGVRAGRERHHETRTARPGQWQTRQSQVGLPTRTCSASTNQNQVNQWMNDAVSIARHSDIHTNQWLFVISFGWRAEKTAIFCYLRLFYSGFCGARVLLL